jgi:hypothetical protein
MVIVCRFALIEFDRACSVGGTVIEPATPLTLFALRFKP